MAGEKKVKVHYKFARSPMKITNSRHGDIEIDATGHALVSKECSDELLKMKGFTLAEPNKAADAEKAPEPEEHYEDEEEDEEEGDDETLVDDSDADEEGAEPVDEHSTPSATPGAKKKKKKKKTKR